MPWWVWLLCVVFMLAMIVAGLVIAARHGLRALHVIGDTGQRLAEPLGRMAEQRTEPTGPEDPSFAQPLRASVERYEIAHAAKLRRRAAVEDRHADAWRRWAED
ncbi:hypothetical protein G1C96_0299 [Bifidobacterium sp. DSM 109958]|uniref:Uncharacterized protein n=1 Tax=Bifidobacterium moraviense TaxID=2675323 RepID=A0A7Y0HXR9_9BIFI|nr:hypothetical protein [Bifidobacterium sp. DSM 109958]NMM99721.1 hypothetical protein [Bifidobacterium sp. DSM 109958]